MRGSGLFPWRNNLLFPVAGRILPVWNDGEVREKKMAKISVAMTAFRGEEFLAAQLDSILRQTLPPDEIILSDDSPDDAVRQSIAPLLAAYPQIRYSRNSVPLGSDRNFERAISLATGDLIFLSDQDDVWLPGKIAALAEKLPDPERVAGVFCDSESTDRDLRPLGLSHWRNRGFSERERRAYADWTPERKLGLFLRRVPAAGHDMAFTRAARELLLPFPALPGCYDTWTGLVIAAAGSWECVPEALTLFRQHESNLSGSGNRSSWRGKLQQARDSIASDSFGWYATLYRALEERLKGEIPEENLRRLADRREHSETRAAMSGSLFRRIGLILHELYLRRYFRYGRGWLNAAQDLLLRT